MADVDGDVNGRGTCPPRSAVEHDTPNRMHDALAAMRFHFIALLVLTTSYPVQ